MTFEAASRQCTWCSEAIISTSPHITISRRSTLMSIGAVFAGMVPMI